MPSSPPHSASKLGCTLAITPHEPRLRGLLGGDHLEVFEPVSAAGHRGRSERWSTTRSSASTTAADRRVADDVEARRDARFGARHAGEP